MAPKVVEALLGTRFRGREFLRSPLARGPPACCLLHPSRSQVPASQHGPRRQVPGPQHVDRGTSRESIVCSLFHKSAAGCSRDLQAHLEQWGISSSVRVPLGCQHALGRAGGGQPKHAGHRLRGPGAVVGLECARHARSRPQARTPSPLAWPCLRCPSSASRTASARLHTLACSMSRLAFLRACTAWGEHWAHMSQHCHACCCRELPCCAETPRVLIPQYG